MPGVGSRRVSAAKDSQESCPWVAPWLQPKPLKCSLDDNSPSLEPVVAFGKQRDLTHGFWVQIIKIQAIALNWLPDFLRLRLI